jgi:hypothetical protein
MEKIDKYFQRLQWKSKKRLEKLFHWLSVNAHPKVNDQRIINRYNTTHLILTNELHRGDSMSDID